jgi:hypothetical protein
LSDRFCWVSLIFAIANSLYNLPKGQEGKTQHFKI